MYLRRATASGLCLCLLGSCEQASRVDETVPSRAGSPASGARRAAVLEQDRSRCFGSTRHGALENGKKLPLEGENFGAYSSLGWAVGRTYVHSAVHDSVLQAYRTLAANFPQYRFVYGETGWETGGSFKPHKTHQNGLSVDFMVPVLDARGASVLLPTGASNKFGYGLEFDERGQLGDLRIDFEAIGEHLNALRLAAREHGIGIAKVIFDPVLRRRLAGTSRWKLIRSLPFTQARVWVRHDDHYHVDFAVPCAAMN